MNQAMIKRNDYSLYLSYLAVVVLGILLVIVLAPVYLILINSFKTTADYNITGPFKFPQTWTLRILENMWIRSNFPTRFFNSMIISGVTTVFAVFLSSCNAFGLAIGKPKGLALLLVFFMFVMTLPAGAIVYPQFFIFRMLGLYNTRIAVCLVLIVTHLAFGTFFLTNVFLKFPRDFIEAAQIDGLGKIFQLFKIVIPLNAPAMSVLFVFVFIWSWNEFYAPLIFLSSADKMTVPLAILLAKVPMAEPQVTNITAISLLTMLPCIVLFVLFRSYLKRGIVFSGVKG